MATHEVNPIRGGNSGLDATSSLSSGHLNPSHDVFGQPLSKTPTALGDYGHPLLKSDHDANAAVQTDSLTGLPQQNRISAGVYGDEFESGIPPIDYAAHLAGETLGAVDKVIESGSAVVKQATQAAVTQIAETVHHSLDTAQKQWNAPDNELRTKVNQRFKQTIDFIKQKVTDLSADPDVKEAMQAATALGQTVAAKTGDFIETAQSATEAWVNKAFDSSYVDSSSGQTNTKKLVSSPRFDRPFVGVIDTGFKAQSHGAQVVNAIDQASQHSPDWLGTGVGTGHWAESLVQFVDAAKSSGRSGAIVNLSFDLTQINPDGSVTTRFELTDAERAALIYAQNNGVLIVASAGNQSGAMSALGQAAQTFDHIITVGAAKGNDRASYSSYGEGLDLVALGHRHNSALSGTSLAAAEVTGTLVELWAKEPQLTARQVIDILHATAKDLNEPGWDAQTGFGLLDRSAAIQQTKITPLTTDHLANFQPHQTPEQEHFERPSWSNLKGAVPSERSNSIGSASIQPLPPSVTVRSGDTLWEIAEQELGEGRRWVELREADGSSFTEQEARQLQIGTEVYLPNSNRLSQSLEQFSEQLDEHSSEQISEQFSEQNLSEQVHIIESGDTLWEIAESQLGDGNRWQELQKADGSTFTEQEAQQLQIGTEVYLPNSHRSLATSGQLGSTGYVVEPGDTLWEIAESQLGDGNRWQELQKADGSTFTEQEAQQLKSGTSVYLPDIELTAAADSLSAADSDQADEQAPIIFTGGTLWGLAQAHLGDGNRWTELRKADGQPFSTQDAKQLKPGTPVYLPSSKQAAKNRLQRNRAIGRMTETVWNGHFDRRSDVVRNTTQTPWRDPKTGKMMPFPSIRERNPQTGHTEQFRSAKSRRLDNFLQLNNGQNTGVEIKGTPTAAESREARAQRARDQYALKRNALMDDRVAGLRPVHSTTTKVGLPILGPGGNTALPGEVQKHVVITPRGVEPPQAKPSVHSQALAEGASNSSTVLRGVSKVARPLAVITDTIALKQAYDQDDGFGKNFQETAGSVAGGWGGAAAGAMAGAALGSVVPGVGTVAGGIIGGVVGGIAGSSAGSEIVKGFRKLFG